MCIDNTRKALYLVVFFFFFLFNLTYSQKVGLVLSGGGAQGLAHIGVLKALEEKNIPISYISGTSIGALIGGMYASGYTVKEIENYFLSEAIKNSVTGTIPNDKTYFLKRKEENASWISRYINPGKLQETYLPTNLISPYLIDFEMIRLFSQSSANANYIFDSLLIPFRCVASDVETKEQVIFSQGNLSTALRASMAYPFYFKPLNYNGHLLYDGGMYNNFPSDVIHKTFNPEVIIGSNVGTNVTTPSEENIYSQLRAMLMRKSDYKVNFNNGVLINMDIKGGLLDFDDAQDYIDIGYKSTLLQMDTLLALIKSRANKDSIQFARNLFKKTFVPLNINGLTIENQDKYTSKHIEKILNLYNLDSNESVPFEKFEKQYFKLIADENIKHTQPILFYNPSKRNYDLSMRVLKQYPLLIELGGNLSSRPISTGFVSLGYQRFKRITTFVGGNFYFGKLYTSGKFTTRFDFPTKLPFAIEGNVIVNQFDFFSSSNIFTRNQKPSFLVLNELNREINLLFPTQNQATINFNVGYTTMNNRYFQTLNFANGDTSDESKFDFTHISLVYDFNTLNKKQFANSGTKLLAKISYIIGEEQNKPGNVLRNLDDINSILGFYRKYHNWLQLKIVYDTYLKQRGKFRFGIYSEVVARLNTRYIFDQDTSLNILSKQFFSNYTATQLVAPSFAPVPEANTYFLTNFRANQYLAFGIKTLYKLPYNIDLRAEGYVFQPVFTLKEDINNKAINSNLFESRKLMGSLALIYQSPFGPISLSMNYYDKLDFKEQNYSIIFTAGYLLFNKKSLD